MPLSVLFGLQKHSTTGASACPFLVSDFILQLTQRKKFLLLAEFCWTEGEGGAMIVAWISMLAALPYSFVFRACTGKLCCAVFLCRCRCSEWNVCPRKEKDG